MGLYSLHFVVATLGALKTIIEKGEILFDKKYNNCYIK